MSGILDRRQAPPSRPGRRFPRGMVIFALALATALVPVLVAIATSSVQAMNHADAFSAKSDDWVGLAAMGSVLVCALLGMVIVRRYTSGPRDDS
jgi:hypothetical protein